MRQNGGNMRGYICDSLTGFIIAFICSPSLQSSTMLVIFMNQKWILLPPLLKMWLSPSIYTRSAIQCIMHPIWCSWCISVLHSQLKAL